MTTKRIRTSPIIVPLEGEDRKLVLDQLDQDDRAAILLRTAQDYSGKTFDRLTSELSEANQSALRLGPMFVGGDTSDMDTFICGLNIAVTDDNIHEVVAMFKAWYALVAPDEYHEMRKPDSLREVWQMPSVAE